jgi:hypothetical protein
MKVFTFHKNVFTLIFTVRGKKGYLVVLFGRNARGE